MSEEADPIIDLPPPPANDGAPCDHTNATHEKCGCGRHDKDTRGKGGCGRFATGCMTGCLISLLAPIIIGVLFACIGSSAISSLLEDPKAASKLEKKLNLKLGGNTGDCDWAGIDEYPEFNEVWSCGDDDDDSAKVVRIAINGVISLDEPHWKQFSDSSASAYMKIKRATLDDEVRGIILEIDSPGGGITASDIIWKALRDFKEAESNRAVVVMMGDTCASGGYYISAAADCIVAHPTTLTGSIGVIINSFNVKELAAKIGVKDVSIASGENKQMLNPFRDLTEEQYAMLKGSVDALHSRFVQIVADGRSIPSAKVREIADGRVFLATEAEKYGLVDKIGYFADSMSAMTKLLNCESIHVIRYEHEMSFLDMLGGNGPFGLSSSLRQIENSARTRLMYKW